MDADGWHKLSAFTGNEWCFGKQIKLRNQAVDIVIGLLNSPNARGVGPNPLEVSFRLWHEANLIAAFRPRHIAASCVPEKPLCQKASAPRSQCPA
jgi:hypothetical protein